jgi:hypothetical protein
VSIITLFTRKTPNIAGIQFDAIMEDTFEAGVDVTGFTIESGVRAADHRVIQPLQWSLIVAVSNNPLTIFPTQFVGALGDGGTSATVAGLASGILSSSAETRTSEVLDQLLTLMVTGEPFTVDIGERILQNMTITNIRRTKTPENETGLFAEVSLQELPTLSTIISRGNQPSQSQLRDSDVSKSQAAKLIDKGEQALQDVGAAINNAVGSTLEAIGL